MQGTILVGCKGSRGCMQEQWQAFSQIKEGLSVLGYGRMCCIDAFRAGMRRDLPKVGLRPAASQHIAVEPATAGCHRNG